MKGLDSIASSLFEKIRGRFPRVELGDETGAPTTDESKARFFDFDYVVKGENKGAVSVSLNKKLSTSRLTRKDSIIKPVIIVEIRDV